MDKKTYNKVKVLAESIKYWFLFFLQITDLMIMQNEKALSCKVTQQVPKGQ